MADRRRLITLSDGGRPVLSLDLQVSSTYEAIEGTFAYAPGQSNQQASREPGRYGGQTVVGEQNDNGTVSWQALVRGSTYDQAAGNIEALLAAANRASQGLLLEWRPDGATYSSYFRVAGPAAWNPTYKWAQWQGALSMVVEVKFPVRPLVLWDPMTIIDPFDDVDSRADYTFDALTSSDVTPTPGSPSGGNLSVSTSLSSERRARHTVRGYKLLEGQVNVASTPWAGNPTGYKFGVLLRASAADTYVEVYIDDNGTNSRLRIDVVIGGSRTNRASSNLAARLNGAEVAVRGRIEGQTVTAEYFNAAANTQPMTAPTLSTSYGLSSPEQSSLVAGFSGWSWLPVNAGSHLNQFEARPFTWRNQTLPQALQPLDSIPGTGPALTDVVITPSGGSAAPAWALIAWGKTPSDDEAPPAIIENTLLGTLSGWSATGTANARGASQLDATAAGAVSASAEIYVGNPEADEFTDEQADVEVWARAIVSSTLVNPRLAVSANGAYTSEFGSAGKPLVKPSSGTVYRFVRLGVVSFEKPVAGSLGLLLKLQYTADGGSTGTYGIDYVVPVLARRRAAGMTGVPAASVSAFTVGTGETIKRVRSDLSASTLIVSTLAGSRAGGLGGALIQPSPGLCRWVVKLSSLVPDDPTSDTTSEQLAHSATVSLDVTPRSYLLRGA